jgi:hypothetical protein
MIKHRIIVSCIAYYVAAFFVLWARDDIVSLMSFLVHIIFLRSTSGIWFNHGSGGDNSLLSKRLVADWLLTQAFCAVQRKQSNKTKPHRHRVILYVLSRPWISSSGTPTRRRGKARHGKRSRRSASGRALTELYVNLVANNTTWQRSKGWDELRIKNQNRSISSHTFADPIFSNKFSRISSWPINTRRCDNDTLRSSALVSAHSLGCLCLTWHDTVFHSSSCLIVVFLVTL